MRTQTRVYKLQLNEEQKQLFIELWLSALGMESCSGYLERDVRGQTVDG